MSLFSALKRAIGAVPPNEPGTALYAAIVAEARRPDWYLAGEVPDTMDGRFDMVALVLSLVLLRLEAEPGDAPRQMSADLADRFITDMDGSLRQEGIGDQVVGKHIGHMMAALGGRLGAYRDAGPDDVALGTALRRNLWRAAPAVDDAVAWVVTETRRVAARLALLRYPQIAAGTIA
jgi:cytochrome b pre-mRNA-processing protein 3